MLEKESKFCIGEKRRFGGTTSEEDERREDTRVGRSGWPSPPNLGKASLEFVVRNNGNLCGRYLEDCFNAKRRGKGKESEEEANVKQT